MDRSSYNSKASTGSVQSFTYKAPTADTLDPMSESGGGDNESSRTGDAGVLSTQSEHMGANSISELGQMASDASADGNPPIVVSADELIANFKASLVLQHQRELEQHGESLSVMCIGEAGAGKTTLVSSLFVQPIPRRGLGTKSTRSIEESSVRIVLGQADASVNVDVRLIDSPGYGDSVNIEGSFQKVVDYLETSFDRCIDYENGAMRPDRDEQERKTGVDAILYFIAPHRLKTLDIEFLRRVHHLASVIPVISKADTLTSEELAGFRQDVKDTLDEENIRTFSDPLAVICCSVAPQPDGDIEYARGRKYPWGVALADNPEHSDLPRLRQILLTDGLLSLHQARRECYEAYRSKKASKQVSRKVRPLGLVARLTRALGNIAFHTAVGLIILHQAKRIGGPCEEEIITPEELPGEEITRGRKKSKSGKPGDTAFNRR